MTVNFNGNLYRGGKIETNLVLFVVYTCYELHYIPQ